jgi:hypothetical protein
MGVTCSASQLGNTPLHTAVSAGHIETAEVLVACGAALELVNRRGVTPLYIAVEAGDVAMTRMLLTYGADITFARPHVRSHLLTLSLALAPPSPLLMTWFASAGWANYPSRGNKALCAAGMAVDEL